MQKNFFYRVHFHDRVLGRKLHKDYYMTSEKEARRRGFAECGEVLSVERRSESLFARTKFSKDYKLVFLNALRFHVEAGASAGKALQRFIESESNPKLRLKLQGALDILSRGGSFSDAMDALNMMDGASLALLKTGEATGRLSEAVISCAEHLENNKASRLMRYLKLKAIGWEFFMGFSGVLSVPAALKHLEETGLKTDDEAKLAAFKAAIAHAHLVTNVTIWGTALVFALLTLIVVAYFEGSGKSRAFVERLLDRIPFIKAILVDSAMSESMQVMSRLIRGRISFGDAVHLTVTNNKSPLVKEFWARVNSRVAHGTSLARAVSDDPALTHDEQVVLAAHQDMSQFSRALKQLSDNRYRTYEAGWDRAVKLSFWAMLGYIGIVLFIGYLVLSTQDMGMAGTMDSIGN
ncbi:type II secretion system F family protein [Ramlibacter alkalitolerans]|uniref:Type II secretion system F family protein n=1 Tax=Ramlibacter alkalitolerans TaxID=2039631 RepID=A0ABS1JU45_9BURK|nr:type II secretion system F family protein [Ramlibacter alkalitolerans]MBL0427754.1 type II secretion system F family protein [Ramlibacter alkalitolerans]